MYYAQLQMCYLLFLARRFVGGHGATIRHQPMSNRDIWLEK